MSESMNPLNDFLEMEENGDGMFDNFPFGAPAAQPVVQNAQTQPPAPAVQPVAQAHVTQMPQQTAPPVQPAAVPTQPVYQATQAAPQAVPQQVQAPVQNNVSAPAPAQGSMFEAAMAQTPTAAQAPAVQVPVAQAPAVNPPAEAPVQQTIADVADPFNAAFANAKAQRESRLVESCAARDAVFCYVKAKEPITDRDCTFEDLREKYETDFPELAESKKVEWTVTYGKESKTINNPGSDKVYEIKAEIEKSKKFIDGIKKGKSDADKNPECIVKPRVKMQSKGEVIPLSSYRIPFL